MRLTKSLLCGISALMLATGAAFAGQDSTVDGSVETSPSELSLEESGMIYIYPMEVTEYYLLIPSESSEMPG